MFLMSKPISPFFSRRVLVSSTLEAMAILWLIIEAFSFFFDAFGSRVQPFWWVFLLFSVGFGVLRAWPRSVLSKAVAGTDSFIELRVTDMFEVQASYLIASNRTFDTSLEDGTISLKSTQGQFTQRFFPNRVDELNRQIADQLEEVDGEQLEATKKPYGMRVEYPIGTTVAVSSGAQRGYFFALSSLNEERVAGASMEDVLDALPAIWEFIRRKGKNQIGPLCCPVLGSGFSRINATREDLVREIVKSFVSACRLGRFCEKLVIAITPADLVNIDFERLWRFLDHECSYPSVLTPTSPVGKPAE